MSRFVSSRLTIIAVVLAVATIIGSVTWAATSSTSNNQGGSSSVVEIVPMPQVVPEGTSFEIAGAGFEPGEVVLFKLVLGGGRPDMFLQGGEANDRGAFLADATANVSGGVLPDIVTPGLYTVKASTLDGHVASAPLIVCKAVEGKCAKENAAEE